MLYSQNIISMLIRLMKVVSEAMISYIFKILVQNYPDSFLMITCGIVSSIRKYNNCIRKESLITKLIVPSLSSYPNNQK